MAEQLGFVFEQDRCMGCKACQVACKDKNDLELGENWRKVIEIEGGRHIPSGDALQNDVYAFWTSMGCNHCVDPLCVKNCPAGALYKREKDGLVLVDESKCIGCRYCTWSCPYEAPVYNSRTGIIGKCDFCKDRLHQGLEPACVGACPVHALHFGNLADLQRQYGKTSQAKGVADPKYTKPALIIKPHRHAII